MPIRRVSPDCREAIRASPGFVLDAGEQHRWHFKAEYLGDPGWPRHWQASGLVPKRNPALTLLYQDVDAIAHQTARLRLR